MVHHVGMTCKDENRDGRRRHPEAEVGYQETTRSVPILVSFSGAAAPAS